MFGNKTKKTSSEKERLTISQEYDIKQHYDSTIEPKYWVARYGHMIWCGDFRQTSFSDKEFEKWIYEVYDLLHNGKLTQLQKELLTEEEYQQVKEETNNMF